VRYENVVVQQTVNSEILMVNFIHFIMLSCETANNLVQNQIMFFRHIIALVPTISYYINREIYCGIRLGDTATAEVCPWRNVQ
jgi:hypothetical protein